MARQKISNLLLLLFLVLAYPVLAQTAASVKVSPDPLSEARDPAVLFPIKVFIPESGSVSTDRITDLINGPAGEVILGTTRGISVFNGTWRTIHENYANISEGLMDDYITAVEFDPRGRLWIGNGGGIQIFNGQYYDVIRDQQILKDPRINDIQRWNGDMWIATGNAGIHRVIDGNWTWYQPFSRGGPGFFEARGMAVDAKQDLLFIVTRDEGLWKVQRSGDTVIFDCIAPARSTYGTLEEVRKDPLGGVYFFSDLAVAHYDPGAGFVMVPLPGEMEGAALNDLTVSSDGTLHLATDAGIFIVRDGVLIAHLGRFEGTGTEPIVKTIRADARDRVWFASQGYVGYYPGVPGKGELIPVSLVTPELPASPQVTATPFPATPPGTIAAEATQAPDSPDSIPGIIIAILKRVASRLGITI
jgi:hypothetical protein